MSTTYRKSYNQESESTVSTRKPVLSELTCVPRSFMKSQLIGLLRSYIVLDLVGHYVRSSPYGMGVDAPLLLSDSLSHQVLFGWLAAVRSYLDMAYGYHLCSLLAVGLKLTEPALWPPMFGSLTRAYTMRNLWGEQYSVPPFA